MRKTKYVLTLFFFSLSIASTHAQLRLGVLAGLDVADLTFSPSSVKQSSRVGLAIGGIMDVPLMGIFSLQLEPMFVQKRVLDKDRVAPEVQIEVKRDYLEVPVMLKTTFTNGKIRPYIVAGPSVGFLLRARGGAKNPDVLQPGAPSEFDLGNITKDTNFGIGAGAGVGFLTGNNHLFLQGRYTHGLINTHEAERTQRRTRDVQILAGVMFSF